VDAFNDGTGPAAAPSVVFVAVGSNCCATSPDGINWTARTIPAASYLSSAYGNGMFVALSTTTVAASSPDGINWTQRSLPLGSSVWNSVTYGNAIFLVLTEW